MNGRLRKKAQLLSLALDVKVISGIKMKKLLINTRVCKRCGATHKTTSKVPGAICSDCIEVSREKMKVANRRAVQNE